MTKFISSETIERVKESYDIIDIISDYIELKKSGSNYVGLCPFHNEKTPSFTVSNSKQFYHCFGCGVSGDGIRFIMEKENLDFTDAIRFLADKLGIQVEESLVDSQYLEEKQAGYEINRDAARFFFKNLEENKAIQEYLRKRQITGRITRLFGLGFALNSWEDLYKHLLGKGHKAEDVEKLGLIGLKSGNNGYYDKFRNRIIFPIIDTKGRVIGFGGRVLDDSMPKYLNSRESIVFNKGYNLYGLNLVSKYSDREKIILVEGYMDVISLFSKGIVYSVASLGTALTEQQGRLLKRFGKEIYICYDSDRAGIKASLKAIEILLALDIKPKIITLPKGMDPDDYINKYGKLEFEKTLLKALNHIDYRILLMKKQYDLNQTEDNIKFTIEVSRLIGSLKSPVEQDVYIDKISKDTGISKEAIKKEIGTSKNTVNTRDYKTKAYNNRNHIQPVKSLILSGYLKAEFDLLRIIIQNIEYFERIKNKLSANDFTSKEAKTIYHIVLSDYNSSESLDLENFKAQSLEEGISQEFIDNLVLEKIEYDPTSIENIIEDLIKTIVLNKLLNKRNMIIKTIEESETNSNQDNNINIEDLFLQLTRINNEIKYITHE